MGLSGKEWNKAAAVLLWTRPIGEHVGHLSSVPGEGSKLPIFLLETGLTGVGAGLTDVGAGWEKPEGGVEHARQFTPPQSRSDMG